MRKSKSKKITKPALLICDMLNTFEFENAKDLLPYAVRASKLIVFLKKHFRRRRLPIIYVNDNFEAWHSDWLNIWDLCQNKNHEGRDIALALKPEASDYFILKPKHSAFHLTALELLLEKLSIRTLVITGIAGDICVLFTAHDAHMREYQVAVPSDCVASNSKSGNEFALRQLRENFKMNTSRSTSIVKQI